MSVKSDEIAKLKEPIIKNRERRKNRATRANAD